MAGFDDPDRDALVAAGVDVAGVLDGHLGVGRVERADVPVVQAVLAADEHLPQGPFVAGGFAFALAVGQFAGGDGTHVRGLLFRRDLAGGGFAGVGEQAVADPLPLVPGFLAGGQALGVAGAVALEDVEELVPVGLGEIVMAAFLVPLEVLVGDGEAEELGLRHGLVDEFLAQLVIGVHLDLPRHRLGRVDAFGVGGPEHHQRGVPEAVERILGHAFLGLGALRHLHHDVVALPLVEAFLLADADHRAGIGAVGGALQRDLVHDGGAVDQPAHRAHVGPGERGVVEDRGVFHLPRQELFGHVVAGDAECFGGGVEVEAVAGLVLHLGQEDHLAFQRGGAGDPVALGQLADDLGMGVLADLADQGLAVALGHPVAGFDLDVGIDAVLEGAFLLRHLLARSDAFAGALDHLCIHEFGPPVRRAELTDRAVEVGQSSIRFKGNVTDCAVPAEFCNSSGRTGQSRLATSSSITSVAPPPIA